MKINRTIHRIWFVAFLLLIFALTIFEINTCYSRPIKWQNSQDNSPLSRGEHTMVFDSANHKIILFGGMTTGLQTLGDTWMYDYASNSWTDLNPQSHPPSRVAHAMVYDSINNLTILYGGAVSETWVYNFSSNEWTQKFPVTQPPPLYCHAMAYDPINQKVILFGGFNNGFSCDDLWAYDYPTNTWAELSPSTRPGQRYGHVMAYDSANQKVILFGGNSPVGYKTDTWEYDYRTNSWTEKSPSRHPNGRKWGSMTYDSVNQKMFLFGGNTEGGSGFLDDTWAYDYSLNEWVDLSPAIHPSQRANTALVYDSVNQKAILFGGYYDYGVTIGDTWAYDYGNNSWISMSPTSSSTVTSSVSPSSFISTSVSSSPTQNTTSSISVSTDFLTLEILAFAFAIVGIWVTRRRRRTR